MERRVLIAVFLSFLVLYGYQALVRAAASGDAGDARRRCISPQPHRSRRQIRPRRRPLPRRRPSPEAAAPRPSSSGDAAEREIVVETATAEATLTNRGGRILHWRLKEYRDSQGEPVDLVPSALPPDQPTPFSLRVDDEQITQQLNTAIYRVTGDAAGRVDARRGRGTLVFEFEDASALRARKEFRFDPANYLVTFSATVESNGQRAESSGGLGPGPRRHRRAARRRQLLHRQLRSAAAGDLSPRRRRRAAGRRRLVEQPVHEGVFRFAGIDDHYFLAAALNPGQARIEFRPTPIAGPGRDAAAAARADLHLSAAAAERPVSSTARSSSIC